MFAKSLVIVTYALGLLMPMAGASAQTCAPPLSRPIAQAADAAEGVDLPSGIVLADATLKKRQRDSAAAHYGRRGDVKERRKAFDIWPEAGFYDN